MHNVEIVSDSPVTVALLTRNAGPLLDRVLEALQTQRTTREVHILAVDSASDDGTVERLNAGGAEVVPIARDEFNFGATRDLAYQHAKNPIVINLSQDAVPARDDWLETLVAPLQDPEVGVSCGASVPDPERAQAQFAWERNGYFYFTREIRTFVKRYGKGVSFANSAVPRHVWEQLRFEALPLGEDFQYQIKLRERGLKSAFPEGAQVLHHHSYDFRSAYQRCRNEGMALSLMGCPYSASDLILDLLSPGKYVQWLRELQRGSLTNMATIAFPVLRPMAVYAGSRQAGSRQSGEVV